MEFREASEGAHETQAAFISGRFRVDRLEGVRSVREFDDVITAPHCGYRDADDYYERASAARVMHRIAVPTLILTAQDDPFVPVASFQSPGITKNQNIQFYAPEHGGHCSFISREGGEERYWAEARIVPILRGREKCADTNLKFTPLLRTSGQISVVMVLSFHAICDD